MKKFFYRSLISIILFFLLSLVYLSTVGIETKRLNKQIGNLLKNLNKDLEIDLKKIKIVLDPLNFELNAKTIGSQLRIKEKNIYLENIKTQISINSFINNNFSIKKIDISTRSLELKNLIGFLRNFKNSPELYFLEKIIKKGYLISDIEFEFDENGNIKNNYKIKGFIKDAKIDLFKIYNLDNINLNFDISQNNLNLNDTSFSINNLPVSSKKTSLKKIKNSFLIEGSINNKDISLNNTLITDFIKKKIPKIDLKNINLNSKNVFSFKVDKNLKIEDLFFSSEIKLNNLELINHLKLDNFFPNIKDQILFNDHLIKINYDKNVLFVKGKGNILIQNKDDNISYEISHKDKIYKFFTSLDVNKNQITIDLLNYKKKKDLKSNLDITGSYFPNDKIVINSFKYKENDNQFKIERLRLDKSLKIKDLKKVSLSFFDEDFRENKIKIVKKKDGTYNLFGEKFNANTLIENLINGKDSNKSNILNQSLNLNIEIKEVYLDKENVIHNFSGYLNFKNNEVSKAELIAFFSKNKKFKYTVNTNQEEKVSTLFLDYAEPVVKRYKFIQGYKGGSLDFYSSKKGKTSKSNLKIYNFKLKKLPILTKLLTLASLQGIADILSGEGISFDEFEMNFNTQDNLITIDEMYAIGPAISILMDGYIEKDKLISLRGSLVPATTINKAIGTIPVLGKLLVGSKTGEGVFGVSFKVKGPPKNLETTVNPIKTLTPRFITRTLEKIKKN